MQTLLAFREVSFWYPRSQEPALKNISLCVSPSDFVVLCGQSGCGKSTLLRHMKKNQIPFGKGTGTILFEGQELEKLDDRESAKKIGYVGQNPEHQIVTDKVWHELAFGLENLGAPREEIRRRTAEMAEYFGMGKWFRESTASLSGGQKQLLNLASVMVMKPQLLILDEPTSQLDPIGARRFIQTLLQLNQDFGTTIILSEQRLEEVLPIADQVMFMHEGELLGIEEPKKCNDLLLQFETKTGQEYPVMGGMPTAMRVALQYQSSCKKGTDNENKSNEIHQKQLVETKPGLPLTVREGKNWLYHILDRSPQGLKERINHKSHETEEKQEDKCKEKLLTKQEHGKAKSDIVLQAKQVEFQYRKDRRLLEDFAIEVERGSIYAILGGNGSGKTTALKVLAGVYRARRGKIRVDGRICYLSQNPQSIFTEITVQDELAEAMEDYGDRQWRDSGDRKHGRRLADSGDKERDRKLAGQSTERLQKRVEDMLALMELTPQRMQNPLDLSGGQQQRLALGKILLLEPDILLLDEPTKGLDAAFKKKFSALLQQLTQQGMTIVMVSHDMEFCARNATHCGLLFDGQMISSNTTRDFFAENSFYTTAASRMSSGILEHCILPEDIVEKIVPGK